METIKLLPYTLDTELTGYMPIPRELLEMDLPSTAVLIYGALLDRGTLSRKNAYTDGDGWVYVFYPVERLAETFHLSDTAVKRHLRELEARGLIRKHREAKNRACHIYLNLPSGSRKGTNCTEEGTEKCPSSGTKVPPNNRKQQPGTSNYYQHGEDESL